MNAKKTAKLKARSSQLSWSRRGQAMVEYSLVSHFLLVGGALAMLPVMSKLYGAFSQFYAGVFFILNNGAI